MSERDMLALVRLDDAQVVERLRGEAAADLVQALEQLRQPVRLSLGQRLLARAAGVDVAAQQQRFRRLIAGVLAKR